MAAWLLRRAPRGVAIIPIKAALIAASFRWTLAGHSPLYKSSSGSRPDASARGEQDRLGIDIATSSAEQARDMSSKGGSVGAGGGGGGNQSGGGGGGAAGPGKPGDGQGVKSGSGGDGTDMMKAPGGAGVIPRPVFESDPKGYFHELHHGDGSKEDGVILDFAGPNFVSVDNFAFGAVARYIQVNTNECYKLLEPEDAATWDDTLKKGVQEFQHRSYSLLTCNCHSFVANNLNRLFYSGHDKWNVVNLAAVMFLRGRWVSAASVAKTFLPFALVLTIGTLLGGTAFLIGLLAFAAAMTGWFLVGTYCIKNLVQM
ncbi:hypothetical protein GUJ93_ZPchr0013g34881 [Zizania palustris]|uniref:Uncharacterized protein n=1 Tax=Zizania palustris TaxID=103762 RepID=A0A8J5WZJ3_ZIZPA|nr:hypothetical protein GUJ93_ZPchr0013g34881 [Zizania palustris]